MDLSPIKINSINEVFLCGTVGDIAQWPEDTKAVTLVTASERKGAEETTVHQVIIGNASKSLSLVRAREGDILYVKGRIVSWYRPVSSQDPTGVTVDAQEVFLYPASEKYRLIPQKL